MTKLHDPMLVFPDERVHYSFCKPRVPLVFEMGLSLVEAFVPTVTPCADIPYFVRMRPKDSAPDDTRVFWPGAMTGKLSMDRIRRLPKGEKLRSAPNFGNLSLEMGSLRYGVQRAVLDWIFPRFRLRVCYTLACENPEKNAVWRIEPSFGPDLVAQWNTSNDVRQSLLEVVRP